MALRCCQYLRIYSGKPQMVIFCKEGECLKIIKGNPPFELAADPVIQNCKDCPIGTSLSVNTKISKEINKRTGRLA